MFTKTADIVWRDDAMFRVKASAKNHLYKRDVRALMAGVLTGQYKAVADDNYDVLTTDAGLSVVQTGTSFKGFSLGPASTYRVNHCNFFINKSSRLLRVLPHDVTARYLFPGQACFVRRRANSTWFISPLERARQTVAFNISPSGDDTLATGDGFGTGSGAKKTLQNAWEFIREYTDGPASISLEFGATFPGGAVLTGDISNSYGRLIDIFGDPTFVNQPQILCVGSDTGVAMRDGAWATFHGIKFASSGSGSAGLDIQQKALADIQTCTWGAMAGGVHLSVDDGGASNITDVQHITGSAAVHWRVRNRAKLIVGGTTIDGLNNTVSFSTAFLQQTSRGWSQLQSPTFARVGSFSGKRYDLSNHSVAEAGGATLPGSLSGTADATSNYY